MKKLRLLECATFVLSFLLSVGAANAQTKLWGVGASNGQADAEFQNAFVQSTTAGSYSATQWTALTVNENDAAVMPGNAYWVRSTTGISQGAYVGTLNPANSVSAANGVAIFDSDFMDNGGVSTAPGTGTSPAEHRGELISPRIDLTGATDSAIVVQFYSYYRPFRLTELSLSISTDDGTTWSTPVSIPALQPTPQNSFVRGMVRAMFPSVTAGVANLSQCRLKFSFDGELYFSILDDIVIEMAPEYDIAIGLPDADAPTYFGVGDMVRIGNNAYNPLVNIDRYNLGEWLWGAKVINNGWKNILPADAPRVKCSIDFEDAVTGALTTGVYLDTIVGGATDSIKSNDRNGIGLVDYLRDLDFIMNNGAGRYYVTYWVEHNNADGTPENDTIRHSFVITDDQGGASSHYLSKARLANSDGRVFARSRIFPGGAPHSAFEYGSVFYFPKGMTDDIKIDSIDFRYYVPSGFTGAANQTMFINIYEYVDGSNGGASNGFVTGDELTQVGIGTMALTGLGTTVANGDYGLAVVRSFADASSGGPMGPLSDGGFYYISVLTQPSLAGGVSTFGFNDVPIHGVDRLNYAMNIGTTSNASPVAPSTMRVVDAAGSIDWFAGFTGFDEVPSIGLHLNSSALITGNQAILEAENATMSVYPNPVGNHLNVEVEFDAPIDVTYIMTDVSGRVVYLSQSKNVTSEKQTIDVSNLAMGVYFVTAETSEGVSTSRFIKK
ncbi:MULTISPECIES: T9SS type A sorting domain-containing protein [unclassified Aureispira]|uniref:T9SS type A sorting domain-containing protein n=1 Tax=unclassified Aureispira TaxID=2649989 RepID=UPI000696D4A4|nr:MULTISPECIES: T9SS type A sorting domain-containing protein [unclassified Aureispira]WMX12683.1 T9SS type A sorting domain-containing protein [Aureispira sp. CCB-E]